jgi:hypothetical protein
MHTLSDRQVQCSIINQNLMICARVPVLPAAESVLEHHQRPAPIHPWQHTVNERSSMQFHEIEESNRRASVERKQRPPAAGRSIVPPDVEGPADAGRAVAAEDAGADALGRAPRRLVRLGAPDLAPLPLLAGRQLRRQVAERLGPSRRRRRHRQSRRQREHRRGLQEPDDAAAELVMAAVGRRREPRVRPGLRRLPHDSLVRRTWHAREGIEVEKGGHSMESCGWRQTFRGQGEENREPQDFRELTWPLHSQLHACLRPPPNDDVLLGFFTLRLKKADESRRLGLLEPRGTQSE